MWKINIFNSSLPYPFLQFPRGRLVFFNLNAESDRGQERTLGFPLCDTKRDLTQSLCISFPQQRMPVNCSILERLLKSETQLNYLTTLLFLLKIMACCSAWTQLEREPSHKVIVSWLGLFSWFPFHSSSGLLSQVLCRWGRCKHTLSMIVWTSLLKYFLVRTFISAARLMTETT